MNSALKSRDEYTLTPVVCPVVPLLFTHVCWPVEDALLAEEAHEELEGEKRGDAQAEPHEQHHLEEHAHRVQQRVHDRPQPWTVSQRQATETTNSLYTWVVPGMTEMVLRARSTRKVRSADTLKEKPDWLVPVFFSNAMIPYLQQAPALLISPH